MTASRQMQYVMRAALAAAAVAAVTGAAVSVPRRVAAQEAAASKSPAPNTKEYFTQKVQPILDENCYDCHTDSEKGGLRLDTYAGIRKGGKSGPILVPGDPETSRMILAIRRVGGNVKMMPPKFALQPDEVAVLETWVKAGAVGADGGLGSTQVSSAAAPTATPAASAQAQATPSAAESSGEMKTTDAKAADSKASVVKVSSATPHAAGPMSPEDFFENNVRPILVNNCYKCHTDNMSGGLRLDSREGMLKGGDDGPVVVPGSPEKSLMITAVHQTTVLKMPKNGKPLSAQEIADLTQWVKQGAVWPASAPGTVFSASVKTGVITEKQRAFWSFQPLKVVAVPEVKDSHWAKTPIDKFVLVKMTAAGLKPAAQRSEEHTSELQSP